MRFLSIGVSLFVLLFFSQCSSLPECKNLEVEGNLVQINSPYDEFAPTQLSALLLFSSNRPDSGKPQKNRTAVFSTQRYSDGWALPELVEDPPIHRFESSGSGTVYIDSARKKVEFYFAAVKEEGNADIYVVEGRSGKWSEPQPLQGINSPRWDGYPAIAPDGSFLVFSSDRLDGNLDLFISFRLGEKLWSIPQPLSELNSRWDEISPVVAPDFTLFFATQAFSANRRFDIVAATVVEKGKWKAPQLLPFPINTDSDEITPFLWYDSLLFASNRPGGCGGYDLYVFPLCPPVLVQGSVNSPAAHHHRETITVFRADQSLFQRIRVQSDGSFRTSLPGNSRFQFVYTNPCYEGQQLRAEVKTPCSFQPTIVQIDFDIPPLPIIALDFPKIFEIGYFVPNYYKPTTAENIQNLRLLLEMELLEAEQSGIPFPDSLYNLWSRAVDAQMEEVVQQIVKALETMNDPCYTGDTVLSITLEGHSAPTEGGEHIYYKGPEIWEPQFNLYVFPSTPLTPSMLALLRAYYTMRALHRALGKNAAAQPYLQRIRWNLKVGAFNSQTYADPGDRRVRVILDTGKLLEKL